MVEIIILHYKNLQSLAICMQSVFDNTKDGTYKMTVIDNGSNDDSTMWLQLKKSAHPHKFNLVINKENSLYTKGYQDYFRKQPMAEFVILMNNDIVVRHGWLEPLTKFMEDNPKCGIVAPMLLGKDTQTVYNMGGLPDFLSHKGGWVKDYTEPEKNWWTTFACVMIRKEAFMKIGGFDEQFQFYCSDSDLCLRMNLADWDVYNVPDSKVIHYHSISTKSNPGVQKIGHEDMVRFNAKWGSTGIGIGGNRFPIEEVKL